MAVKCGEWYITGDMLNRGAKMKWSKWIRLPSSPKHIPICEVLRKMLLSKNTLFNGTVVKLYVVKYVTCKVARDGYFERGKTIELYRVEEELNGFSVNTHECHDYEHFEDAVRAYTKVVESHLRMGYSKYSKTR